METVPSSDAEALLADDGRLRRLARRLVRDPSAADDLVQEAWLEALRRPGAARSRTRWLAGVVRRTRLARARADHRRRAREAAVARSERVPGPDEVAAELDLRRRVLDAVERLDEPYRTAVVLRFFRDEPLKRVAERQGVAVSTASERVREGLARMRRDLDRAHGGRRSEWALALLALEPPGAAALTTIAGGIAMGTTAKAAVAAAVVVAAAGAWVSTRGGVEAPPRAAAAPAAVADVDAERPRDPLQAAARAEEPQRVVAATDQGPAGDSAEGPAARVLRGRVVDFEGNSISGARVVAGESDDAAVTDREGRFELTSPEAIHAGDLALDDPVLQVVVRDEQPNEILLVASRRLSFAGVVVDPENRPVGGTHLSVKLRDSLFRDLGIPADGRVRSWDATSGVDGRFEIQGAPGGERVILHARADGYDLARVELPEVDDAALVVRLAPPRETIALSGVVLDPRGRPFEGALVATGGEVVRSDESGEFALAWRPAARDESGPEQQTVETHLTAVHDGYAPARLELTPEIASRPIELRLGARPLSIDGIVVDDRGEPLDGIVLWVTDPTYLGNRFYDGPLEGGGSLHYVETCDARSGGVTTKENGSFRLERLLDRVYHVAAYDPDTMSLYEGWDVPAGTADWRVVMRPHPDCRQVSGRVVWSDGRPVAGVRLVPQFHEKWMNGEVPGGTGPLLLRGATTDEEGRFVFEHLFTDDVWLLLQGEMLEMLQFVELTGRRDLEDLEIVARRRCELQIELSDPSAVGSALVLDARGEPVEIQEPRGNAIIWPKRIYLREGRSSVVFVSESARTIVLMRGAEEIRRVQVQLDPDERTVLRL